MTLRKHLERFNGDKIRYDDFTKMEFSVKDASADDPLLRFRVTRERVLTMRLNITYWSSDADLEQATEQAGRYVEAKLYEGILTPLHLARTMIHGGDKKKALAALDRIHDVITGATP